ncbi:MAG TPA: MFS transporter [Stellaceae bacterium]|nr:MFS transporter [Stellaceae bacterium]
MGEQHSTAPVMPAGNARWVRLIPIAMIIYVISFMDRTNISYAFAGIGQDFGVTKEQQGLAAGIFFVGYVLLQIPGGYLAERWSAKKFIGIMILVWGVCAVACGLVQSFNQLIVVRFFLGVAEGGVWPATLVLLSHWFPVQERARAYSFWMANLAIASIITQPISGFIVSETSWRTLFIIEGLLPFVIATPIWWLFVKDRPSEASWVTPEELHYIESTIARDKLTEPAPVRFVDIFSSGVVWQLVIVYFLVQVGFYGLNLWLPTVVKNLTNQGFGLVGVISALPYITAIACMWLNGSAADKSGKYPRHVLIPMAVAACSLVLSVMVGSTSQILSIAFLCLAMGGALAYDGPFWAAASRAMPAAVVGGAMGFINALGNLGGYLGPYLAGYLQDKSGDFFTTAFLLAASLLLAGLFMMTVRIRAEGAAATPMSARI